MSPGTEPGGIPPVAEPAAIDSGRRWAIMGAVMLGLFLSAMDQTIVGTAMPRIIADLRGFELYSWVVTSYILCSTTLIPIVGKLGDIYGRKMFFMAGIVVFLLGSVLCGASQDMVQLIIFRGVQGVGGGMIFANAFAIVADLFTPAERGRYTGVMSSVFGLASIIGPLVGGAITDHIDWRWVFYVNIPLGLVALVVLALVLPAGTRHEQRKPIDYLGAALLIGAIAPLLLGFSWGGTEYPWASAQVVTPFALSAVFGAAFLIVEMRAADPVIPLHLFKNRIFAVCTAVTFVSGAAMFAGMVYIPLFMQAVLGFTATNAGLVMTPMTLSLVAGSIVGGQLVSRTGRYRWQAVGGMAIGTVGLFMLSRLDTGSSRILGMQAMAVMGFGLGLSFPVLILASQNALPAAYTGVTTSLNQFSRSVGSTIGVAILGSVLTRRLNDEITPSLPPEVRAIDDPRLLDTLTDPNLLLSNDALTGVRAGFDGEFGADGPRLFEASLDAIRGALATSITEVFLIAMLLMAVAVFIAVFLHEIPLRQTFEMAPAENQPPDVDPAGYAAGRSPAPRSAPAANPISPDAS